jgi:putative AbiEii toxin of type IV toxin-antitoxin system
MDFSSRLNVLTGDNGLGKSFLLDVSWWALTRTWAREFVVPHPPPTEPSIKYSFDAKSKPFQATSKFDRLSQEWSVPRGRPSIPGLVIYAQVDGGFSVWDPARNYWKGDDPKRLPSFLFKADEVWEGSDFCEGLLRDWASWQREDSTAFEQLKAVLKELSPSQAEPLEPGDLKKVYLDDPKKHPTLKMAYGQEVPLIHASAGMRRIIALAYLLVWTWQEHQAACELTGGDRAGEIIFLIDEIEAHLHPQWQRRVVPSILKVMDALTGDHDAKVQLVAATHSPLVLASSEPLFDPNIDVIWELDVADGGVTLERYDWHRRGDASAWLTSSIFDLKQATSVQAEEALQKARSLLRSSTKTPPTADEVHQVDDLLRASLSDIDGFWLRWSAFKDEVLGIP